MEVRHLREILRADTEGYAKLAESLKQDGEENQWKRKSNSQNEDEEQTKIVTDSNFLQEKLKEMQQSIQDMEKESSSKNELLDDMKQLLLNVTAKNDKKEKGIQVGESELEWNVIPTIK